jgi:hypothetical protein
MFIIDFGATLESELQDCCRHHARVVGLLGLVNKELIYWMNESPVRHMSLGTSTKYSNILSLQE